MEEASESVSTEVKSIYVRKYVPAGLQTSL